MMEQEKIATKDEHGEAPRDPLFEWYISAATDYVHKVALATIMFFTCWPWAALFWPPYYFMRRASQ